MQILASTFWPTFKNAVHDRLYKSSALLLQHARQRLANLFLGTLVERRVSNVQVEEGVAQRLALDGSNLLAIDCHRNQRRRFSIDVSEYEVVFPRLAHSACDLEICSWVREKT
jgi:hypothetical protein